MKDEKKTKRQLIEELKTLRQRIAREKLLEPGQTQADDTTIEHLRIYEALFSTTTTPLVLLDRNFNFIRVNEAYAKACQRDMSEFPGHNHFEFYPSEAKDIFEQVVKMKKPFQAVARPFIFPDHPEWGTTYWDWTLTPLVDETGEVQFLLFSLNNVTKQKQAENGVKKSEARYRTLVEQIPAVIYTVTLDEDSTALYLSPQIEKLLGFPPDEYHNTTADLWMKQIHPDDRDRVKAELTSARETGHSFISEYRIFSKDGRLLWFRDEATVVRDEHGKPLGLQGIMFDITQRKRAENALQETFSELDKRIAERASELQESNESLRKEISERKKFDKELRKIEWLLTKSIKPESLIDKITLPEEPSDKDLDQFNPDHLLANLVGKEILLDIIDEFIELLDTSTAIYEKNGDYVIDIFTSSWCQLLNQASRNLCGTDNLREAVKCGKWHCHESCWTETSKPCINTGQIVDRECRGGIRIFAVPIRAGGEIIGSINFGYGDPPRDPAALKTIAHRYRVRVDKLLELARAYESRPSFLIDFAKNRLINAAGMIGTLVELKQAEEKLKRSEERYALAQRVANIGSWDWDIKTGVLTWSEQIEPMFGFSQGKFKGTYEAFLECVHPEDHTYITDSVNACITRGKDYAIEHRIVWPDGSIRWVSETGDVIRDSNGSPIRMLGITQDITERKHIEEALKKYQARLEYLVEERTAELQTANLKLTREITERQRAEEELRNSQFMLQSIFESISEPLFLLDKNFLIIIANQATVDYCQRGSTPIKGMPCYTVFKGRDTACEECRIAQAMKQSQFLSFEQCGEVNLHGYEWVTVYPLRAMENQSGVAIVHLRDITKTRVLERRVLQSEKLNSLGLLVSGITHEIHNPNTFISFNIPILRDYLKAIMPIVDEYANNYKDFFVCNLAFAEFREDIFKLLDNMEHGSERINKTVSHLREFVRTKEEKELVWTDMGSLVERVLTLCKGQIQKGVKSFTVSVPGNFPRVYTDPDAVEHILINLLINAVQAMDKRDSYIRLAVFQGSDWQEHMVIEVSDNGCGIEEEHLKRVFDPFFTTKSSEGGTGLGMYLCKNMAEGLGGRIEVASTPGAGTTVQVTLPDMAQVEIKAGT